MRIASLVMEMWFRWHSSLWGYCYFSFKVFKLRSKLFFPLFLHFDSIYVGHLITKPPFVLLFTLLAVQNFSRIDAYDISLPDLLLQPVKTAIIDQIL